MRFSYSSFNCFDRCKRQYYYTQIAANHKAKNDILRKEAHYLKQLTSTQFWPGKLVEATIEDVLIEGRINPASGNIVHILFEYARSLAENQFNFSLSNQFRNVTQTAAGRNYFRLFEHEYEIDDTGIKDSVIQDVLKCIGNYPSIFLPEMGISLHSLLTSANQKRKQVPVPIELYGASIACMLDCLVLFNSRIVILDWKVSKTTASDFSRQLLLYALAVSRSYWADNRRLQDIYSYEVNLYNAQTKYYKLDEEKIIKTEDFIFDFVRRVEDFTQNKKYKELDIEDFPMCENLYICENCNFQKICIMNGSDHGFK